MTPTGSFALVIPVTDRPLDRPAERPSDHPSDRSADRGAERPPDRQGDRQGERPAERARVAWPSISLALKTSLPGLIELGPQPHTLVCIHVGPSVRAVCRRAGQVYRGLEVHGGIDLIPAGTACVWEVEDAGRTLVIRVPPALLSFAAAEAGEDPDQVELINRFQIRDPQIEHLAWALKADLEAGGAGGRLFRDGLGLALATQLLARHSAKSQPAPSFKGGMSGEKLKRLLGHIEDHLDADLSLADIAAVAGLSVSHVKTLFRRATGLPIHQYVIRRRVERAETLLRERKLSISEIALATGFAHQSHLSRHLRRLRGVTPAEIRQQPRSG